MEHVSVAERVSVSSEQVAAAFEQQELGEHRERACVHLRERNSGARELQRRLAEPLPREPSEALPELAESGRKPRNGAGRRADRVDDELVAEGNRQLGELSLAGRNRREAVEVHDAGAVEDDGMAACEKPAHDGLGDARSESHRHHCVGCRPSVGQDLRTDGGSGRMACGDSRPHGDDASCR